MTFDHDFGYSLPSKKRGKKKRRMKSKNRDQKPCLSARSNRVPKNWNKYSITKKENKWFIEIE